MKQALINLALEFQHEIDKHGTVGWLLTTGATFVASVPLGAALLLYLAFRKKKKHGSY